MLGLLFQLEHSQWLASERLRERQLQQLCVLLKHAYNTVPWYRERWRGAFDPALPLTPERFAALPVLTRQGAGLGIAPDVANADFALALTQLGERPGYAEKAREFARRYAGHDRNAALATMIARIEAALPH